jgi:hypothetical protein
VTLRDQVNKKWPKRDKASDGWIGDPAHAARLSDHNPDSRGWVHALDIDEDLGGVKVKNKWQARRLANQLRRYAASGLPGAGRIKYVVYENRLASGTYASKWWQWRPGNWGHEYHIHVSFTKAAETDPRPFPLPIFGFQVMK